jgi:hypothetical protein
MVTQHSKATTRLRKATIQLDTAEHGDGGKSRTATTHPLGKVTTRLSKATVRVL